MIRLKAFQRYLAVMAHSDIKTNIEEIKERINQAFLRRQPVNIFLIVLYSMFMK